MIKHNTIKHLPGWLLILVAVFISTIFIVVLVLWYFSYQYQTRFSPGVQVAKLDLGGKTINEAKSLMKELLASLDRGIPVSFKDKTIYLTAQANLLNPDAATQLFFLDPDNTLKNAWAIGHTGKEVNDAVARLNSFIFGNNLEINATIDREAIANELKNNFSANEVAPINASVSVVGDKTEIIHEQAGLVLDYNQTINQIIKNLYQADNSPVVLQTKIVEPTIFYQDIEANLSAIKDYLTFPKTKLVYQDNSWELNNKLAGQWLGFIKNGSEVRVNLDKNKIKQFLIDKVALKVNHEPVQARLSMVNGRASVWQAGEDGVEVDLDKTAELIAAWPEQKSETIAVAVKVTPTGANDMTAESLGLKEIIGTGISQFTGSPANRRHNIKVGASKLNGLLIKPGEEFSLLKALGKIDGSTGYLQELVIKENKTIPEYGGGLCQIGTTMFRATFNSGLPVTQRRNHSYRVSYYEPAGTDATIYDPSPDYRFINDTGHYILIQTRLGNDTLAFDFWGTKDGRQVEFSRPTIYNIVKPEPTKIVETTDLKEGEKKCTEKSHNGADAYFDYKVTYSGGEIKKTRFSSHYVPWQAVCLVGVKKLSNGSTPGISTSTVTPIVTSVVTPEIKP